TFLSARYARIYPFSGTNPQILMRVLSPADFKAAVPPMPVNAPNKFIGDYQWIHAEGCSVYACYMSTRDFAAGVDRYGYYLQKITICAADSDSDGFITSDDPIAFGSAYIASSPNADLNSDLLVNATDISIFTTAYQCQCNP